MKKEKIKLADLLEERGFENAASLALAGRVFVNGEKETRSGRSVSVDDLVEVRGVRTFVSRSGAKLAGAVEDFGVDLTGRVCLDLGSSTGGFSQVLLKAGAQKVIAVDVGYGQLDFSIRSDPRVSVLDRTDARSISAAWFGAHDLDSRIFVTCDISFLSLRTILDALLEFSRKQGAALEGLFLLKPQFEASKKTEKGIIKDNDVREKIVADVLRYAKGQGWVVIGHKAARVTGARGNQEYMVYLRTNSP